MQRIVVIEDEHAIANAVTVRLRGEGYEVATAADGPTGVALVDEVGPDLVILDVMLPGMDGLEVCRRIQSERPVPVLMLTALDTETDLLVGLGVGADDYMTKPFSPREMVARVKALLRRVERSQYSSEKGITVLDVELDPGTRQVRRGDEDIHLTPTEFDLLYRLASRPDMVFSREQILADVWGYRDGFGARTVDSHVAALRRKLGGDVIRTVHGVGYATGAQN
ncbi:MAG: response regulator transcription factor [Actinobacteria bacterium]|nr:response regulator transcription factor [Actinomycetota bacterium]